MSEDKKENDEKMKKIENIKDIKDDDELQSELKEWEVESTHSPE